MRIAIVSREVHPMAGGGIAPYVTVLADVLREVAEVTIVTSDRDEQRWRELRAAGHPGIPADDVRMAFVREPRTADERGGFYSDLHIYGARVLDKLRELYPDGGPDVLEFSDYLGEGAVTVQAALALDPFLRDTTIVVKLHTTSEIVHVLNGSLVEDPTIQATYSLERLALKHADRLLFGGGAVGETYERFYGRDALAPWQAVRQPVLDASHEPMPDDASPLRLLYLGRLERRKGVENLIRAVTAVPSMGFRLTLVGGDTDTAPLGLSMRGHLELMAGEDARIDIAGRVDPSEIPGILARHHAVIVPSQWECWPNTGLEALRANRPLIGTPVGGLVEMAGGPGGWLAADNTTQALVDLLEQVVADPERILRLGDDDAPRRRFEELTDQAATIDAYHALAKAPPRKRRVPRERPRPMVSVVVPYYRLPEYIEETIASISAQTYRPLEVIVVNDGSFREEDAILDELRDGYGIRIVSQPNRGLGAARNVGIRVSRGRYVLPMDADDVLDPTFVARCVAILEADPRAMYATSWLAYMDEDGAPAPQLGTGYEPLGNESHLLDEINVAGSAISVFRRRLFDEVEYDVDMTSYEDWLFFRDLQHRGMYGRIIPERLISYRIRTDSMVRQSGFPKLKRLRPEMNAHHRRNQLRWTSSSA